MQTIPPAVQRRPEPMMVVTCPAGVQPGMHLTVVNPTDGLQMQFEVPEGVRPGQRFQVEFPGTSTVVQGQPIGIAQGYLCLPNARECRGCGQPFEPPPGTNPASAAAFRCINCYGLHTFRFFW